MPDALPGTRNRRRVYLMRHGDVRYYDAEGRRVGEPDLVRLTEEGEAQAKHMADVLADVPFDRACHTGLLRTEQTARLTLNGRDVPLGAAAALREIHTGPVDALPEACVEDEYIYAFETAGRPGSRFARGEAFADFYGRISAGVQALLVERGWTRLLLVAHGGTNRAILSWLAGNGPEMMGLFEQDMCCLNIFDVDVDDGVIGRRHLRLINQTPYNMDKERLFRTSLERGYGERGQRSDDSAVM